MRRPPFLIPRHRRTVNESVPCPIPGCDGVVHALTNGSGRFALTKALREHMVRRHPGIGLRSRSLLIESAVYPGVAR